MPTVDSELTESSFQYPERIGPYKIVRVLGEGGMGTVYEAAETGPVRRNVALKVVRAGFGSREIRARFEAERQALALMDHAGIAKVLQAGETAEGDPFFAMELVKGLPLTEYCDTRRLSTEERLRLFICVCQAVQHAHQKGVIHRDLKPTNVLVAEQDGKPLPKVIDFGIAKALGMRLTENTLVTQAGYPIGTLAYMSPEQAESSGIDVDTRTDIYSLGVILYLLLVGSLPAEPTGQAMQAFIFRLASGDTNAPRPSARYTAVRERQKAIADARRTNPEHLRRDLKGDLDWIVMKALEPDRSRRYETATGFAADIERFLAHKPVVARPPTSAYRLGKFVRRHRAGVAATSVAVLALVLSAVFAATGLIRATRAERHAAEEAAAATQVSDFMINLFRVSEPGEALGNSITARELLDRGAKSSLVDLAQQPRLQGRMMHTIGTAYASLGLYDAARAQLETALETRKRALGAEDPAVAETQLALGDALVGHGDLALAESHYQPALAILERFPGAADSATAVVVRSIAALRWKQGRNSEAESMYKRAISLDERRPGGGESRALAKSLAGLGVVYWAQQRNQEAVPLMRRSISIQERRLGPGHPELASVMNNLGAIYWSEGRYAAALPLYERTRGIFERTLDPTHPNMAAILNNLAETYWKLGRYKEAEPLFRRALAIKETRLTRGNPSIAVTLNGLAGMLRDAGRPAESEAVYQRALDIRLRALGPLDPNVAETVKDYAQLLKNTGRTGEADALVARHTPKR
ncbi:MAG: serine/threonine protein kinase [Gemmatimonadaceae bacterium]|nr:serine/threonine protein kinase [Gemmatimonadaceae bacterium]